MQKVIVFSLLLLAGLAGSQMIPRVLGGAYEGPQIGVEYLTLAALAFIMIHVGYEFEIDKSNVRGYGWDYVVAMTAAAFPWILVTLYFIAIVIPGNAWTSWDSWTDALLAGRFAAPTSAGVLFSMLAAAGLSATWLFRKARVLAIFDDLDTVLLMIPLQMLIVGLAWQLGLVVAAMGLMLWMAWKYLRAWAIPVTWPWVMGYALAIAGVSEVIYLATKQLDPSVPLHFEVLLPAFVLGCMLKRPAGANPHADDAREGHQEGIESAAEQRVATYVSAAFMVLVGLSLPQIGSSGMETTWTMVALHVVAVTVLSNIGKMFPAFCYRREAHWRERMALAIGMWPRGEVGAGVLVVSLGFGIGGAMVTVAMLSLALNLLLTGVFIWAVKRLIAPVVRVPEALPAGRPALAAGAD